MAVRKSVINVTSSCSRVTGCGYNILTLYREVPLTQLLIWDHENDSMEPFTRYSGKRLYERLGHEPRLKNLKQMETTNDPEQVWRMQKAKLLMRFSKLVEADFLFDYGMKEKMLCRLQVKLGKSREELNALLLTLL